MRVSHCLAGFESLFSPSGGSRAEMTLLRVRREERGKDYPDEDVADGWRVEEQQQTQHQTAAKTIIINCKLSKRTENIAYNLPGGNCGNYTHIHRRLSTCLWGDCKNEFSVPSKACNAASNFILTDTLLKVQSFFVAQRKRTVCTPARVSVHVDSVVIRLPQCSLSL